MKNLQINILYSVDHKQPYSTLYFSGGYIYHSSITSNGVAVNRNILLQISDSEKDIMSSLVYCIHHKEGCKWNDQLRKLKV